MASFQIISGFKKAFVLASLLSACSASGVSGPTDPIGLDAKETAEERATPIAEHEAEQAARELIRLSAAGEFAAAAEMTDNPEYMLRQFGREINTYGLDQTKERWQQALTERDIRSITESGDYAMILVERPHSDYSPVASEIYKRGPDGSYKVALLPGPDIPCVLVREYFKQKGEPDGEAPCAEQ